MNDKEKEVLEKHFWNQSIEKANKVQQWLDLADGSLKKGNPQSSSRFLQLAISENNAIATNNNYFLKCLLSRVEPKKRQVTMKDLRGDHE